RPKRAKPSGPDSDETPQFSFPSMPLSETTREQSPPKESDSTEVVKPADKENVLPVEEEREEREEQEEQEERDHVPERPTIQPPNTAFQRSILEESPDYDGK